MDLLRHQTTLARFGELALGSDDLDVILTEACRLVAEALGTELAKVVELHEDGRTLRVRAGVGWGPGVVGLAVLPASEDTSEGHALLTGEPMISPDIRSETRFEYAPFLIENGVRAIANVLIIGGKGRPPFGILQVDSRNPRDFTDEDTAFLRSYANLIAATVDRLRINQEVRDAEARFRLALETGELGSWDFDLVAGTATHTPRCDQIFGYDDPPPAWSYDAFLGHVVPEDRDQVAGAFRRTMADKTDWAVQCRIKRAGDGGISWIEARGRPYGGPGDRPTHLQGIVADITDRKQAEDSLRRSHEALEERVAERTRELTNANDKLRHEAEERERVEDALRQAQKMEAVGQLTGGIAHDFNNVLTGIMGSLHLMRRRIAQGRVLDLDRYVDAASASADRAAALTQRLLAFSRRQTLAPRSTDVSRLVAGMEDLFRRTVGAGIRIETSLGQAPCAAMCDPNQLENALLNLVINARDAMPDGGRLSIETADVTIPESDGVVPPGPGGVVPPGPGGVGPPVPGGAYVVLTVTDSGMGMAPDVMARAFDPFFTTKPPGQGTGLGLAMVHSFVQQSGGHVRLRSEQGKGLEVTLYLPGHDGTTEAAAESPSIEPAPARARKGAGILVVEEEPSVRMVIVDALVDQGYSVHAAADDHGGLEVVRSDVRLDLLLTDIGLPGGMNGRELTDAARRRHPDLKVLFVTGTGGDAAIGDAGRTSDPEIIEKPFAIDALIARVRSLIETDEREPAARGGPLGTVAERSPYLGQGAA